MSASAITFHDTHQAIPQDKGFPVVGCLPKMVKDPLDYFKSLAREHEDIVEFKLPLESVALVVSPDLCHQILSKQHNLFRKSDRDMRIMGSLLGNGLVTINDHASHKKHRKLVQPGFHFRRIQDYAETMIDYASAYHQAWADGEVRDINDDMFKLSMYIVSKTLFDINMNSMSDGASQIGLAIHRFQEISDKRFHQPLLSPKWLPTKANREVDTIRTFLDETVEQMINERRSSDGGLNDKGDLLSMLLNSTYEDGSEISRSHLMDELITLFVAGHETTSNALTWTFYLVAKHPEVQQRLQAELDDVLSGKAPTFEDLEKLSYTEMVIKESMRLYPPAWTLNSRQANEDVLVGDYLIPKNKIIFVAPIANHHNPRYFPNPETFDPERFSPENEKRLPRYAYMPFGGGPRVCIGNSFAMMEAKVALATLAKNYSFETVAEQEIEPLPQITLSNKGGMKLRVKARA